MARQDSFHAKLAAKIKETKTSLCVGIDPPLGKLPAQCPDLESYANALVDAAAPVAPAVKFQSAFFEAHGSAGFAVLERSLKRARDKGLVTLLDAKRGDISSTMAAYGEMAFRVMGADALTVTPYMGLDTVEPLKPFLEQGKGVYLVWVTSNPGGKLLQDSTAELLYAAFQKWFDGNDLAGALGLVLGATKADDLPKALVDRIAATSLLMPGVGPQGGVVTDRIKDLIRKTGKALVPLSRGIAQDDGTTKSWADFKTKVEQRTRAAAAELALA